nr:hypothetical protein [uncultured Undibacterium sp.]
MAKRLQRDDASSEVHHFLKLFRMRIDVAIIGRSTHEFLVKHQPDLWGKFPTLSKSHDQYDSGVLFPQVFPKGHPVLGAILQQMHVDPAWNGIVVP